MRDELGRRIARLGEKTRACEQEFGRVTVQRTPDGAERGGLADFLWVGSEDFFRLR